MKFFQLVVRALVMLAGFAVALTLFLLAWWLALLLIAGVLGYAWLRGLGRPGVGRRADAGADAGGAAGAEGGRAPAVIEGDFTVVRDSDTAAADDRAPPR